MCSRSAFERAPGVDAEQRADRLHSRGARRLFDGAQVRDLKHGLGEVELRKTRGTRQEALDNQY